MGCGLLIDTLCFRVLVSELGEGVFDLANRGGANGGDKGRTVLMGGVTVIVKGLWAFSLQASLQKMCCDDLRGFFTLITTVITQNLVVHLKRW